MPGAISYTGGFGIKMGESRHINEGEKIVSNRFRVNKRWQNPFRSQVVLLHKLMVKYNLEGIFDLLSRPGRLVYLNFMAGVARGFGIAVGLTIVSAIFLAILAKIASLNLPIISNFIARLVRLVNEQLPY
ncbi:MAG: hypothetical protein GX073_08110 [Firmicutes bacterium]|nr:hypothetical protein [Bacillota bacterium]